MSAKKKIGIALILAGIIAAGCWAAENVRLRPADPEAIPAEDPAEGVGRIPAVTRYLGAPEAEEIGTAVYFDTYTEGDAPAPEWYRPDEEMAVEWFSYVPESMGDELHPCDSRSDIGGSDAVGHPPVGIDAGGIDWNLCTELVGWDGHRMERWEMDAFARVAYLEFWGTSRACCEAGVDAILQLWDSGYFAPSMFGTLSAEAENGAPVFSTWDAVWETDYDPAGLAEMRELCEDRFADGPEYEAEFFRTDYYHPWAEPMYQIDNVYFSTGRGWN